MLLFVFVLFVVAVAFAIGFRQDFAVLMYRFLELVGGCKYKVVKLISFNGKTYTTIIRRKNGSVYANPHPILDYLDYAVELLPNGKVKTGTYSDSHAACYIKSWRYNRNYDKEAVDSLIDSTK